MMEGTEFITLNGDEVGAMAVGAKSSERLRVHHLLHSGHDDPVQRLLIVMQPNTYVRPHRHPHQWEMLVLLEGRGALLRFDEGGCIADRIEMNKNMRIAQIPAGVWHGFLVLEANTAVMEVKPGPFQPSDFAIWAPPEGDDSVRTFLQSLEK